MTSKDLKEFQKLIKYCQKNKVTHLKYKDFEVRFDSLITEIKQHQEQAGKTNLKTGPAPIPDHTPIKEDIIPEEDMLLWSTPHYQEEKPQVNGDIEQ